MNQKLKRTIAVTLLSACAYAAKPVEMPQLNPGQPRPRLYLQAASTGNTWASLRNQSIEMSKDFGKICPDIQITLSQQAADYTIGLNHIEVGWIARNNQLQIATRNGDQLGVMEGGSIIANVKKACFLLLTHWTRGNVGNEMAPDSAEQFNSSVVPAQPPAMVPAIVPPDLQRTDATTFAPLAAPELPRPVFVMKPMTNQDVIELKAAGLSDEFVIAKIQRSPAGYQLDTSDIVALKRSNISEPVIQAMMAAAAPTPQQPSVPPTAANAPTQSQPPPQPPSPATAPTASAGSAQQTNQNTAATEPPKDGLLTRLKRVFSDDGETRKPSTPQTLPAEQQAPPQISLVPITVISKPAGARISVDGYPAGFTPSIVKLMPGTYKLTLQADGLPAYTQQITVEPGQVRSFGVVLDTPK
jgi:hypothetical protein